MIDHRLSFSTGTLVLVIFALCSSCSQSIQQGPNTEESQDRQLATSESALSDNGDDDQASDGNQGDRVLPPGFGNSRIEYNHHFSFNMMRGGSGLSMEINIVDYVPISTSATGFGTLWCQGEDIEWAYRKVIGQKALKVNGTGLFAADDESCNCEFTDTIDVTINGVTHADFQNQGDQCMTEYISVEFNENWYTSPDWTCSCDDPEKNQIAEMNMEQIPSSSPSDLREKTLRFTFGCPGQFRQETMTAGVGQGSYDWTWTPGFSENKTDPMITQHPDELDQDIYSNEGPPSCVHVVEPPWGPPLSSIDPGVTEWHSEGY